MYNGSVGNKVKYTISFADGSRDETHDTYGEALASIRKEYGPKTVIGHDGDLTSFGDRTLFWGDKKSAHNDSGANALGSIRRTR